MKRFVAVALGFAAALVDAGLADADYLISLRDGRRIRAPFVRVEGAMLHVSQATGELVIDQTTVASIAEVEAEPVAPPAAAGPDAPPIAAAAAAPSPASPPLGPDEKERAAARRLILGHRDLLFARLRGDAPAELEKREKELKRLQNERLQLREQKPSWDRSDGAGRDPQM